MQGRAFRLKLSLDDFFRIVPGAAGVRHEDRLIETEERDRNQIANEEEGIEERESQGGKEDGQEDVEHSLLRILSADLDHFLRITYRCPRRSLQFNIRLDELHRSI